jgi:hypothetical protein
MVSGGRREAKAESGLKLGCKLLTPALEQTIDLKEFKRQLLEFIEDRDEPFKVEFLVESCLQPASDLLVQNTLAELEGEGLIIWLGGGE